jgi:ribosomal protein S18 acetylase RimI-like enzyme
VGAAGLTRSGAERRARTTTVTTVATAQNGPSGVPAEGKHAGHGTTWATQRTGVQSELRPASSFSYGLEGQDGAVPDNRVTAIRPARPEDAPRLQHIELATQGQFVAIGYDQDAANPPDSIELLVEYARAGRSWVAAVDDEVVGYILVGVLDDAAHIFHVCVHPGFQGQGLGKALIEQAKGWARSTGRPALTLATFYEVPWNGPLYEHLGFRVMDESELGPEMLAGGEHDVARGLSPKGQVAMRLDLDI